MKILKNILFTTFGLMATPALSIDIEQCNFIIDSPGTYNLRADLDCSELANPLAIRVVNTQNVEINLRGYSLFGKPNATYGGTGTGIAVYNSNNVEIDGSNHHSVIQNFSYGIKVQNSFQVKVDGDLMTFRENAQAVLAVSSHDLEFKQLRFQNNVQRDMNLSNGYDLLINRTFHKGETLHGILVSQFTNVKIKDARIGNDQQVRFGVILYNTSDVKIEESEFDQAESAVVLTGDETFDVLLEDNDFGDNAPNNCDVQVAFNAQQPYSQDNDPNNLTFCN